MARKIHRIIPTNHFRHRCRQRLKQTAEEVLQDWSKSVLMVKLPYKEFWRMPSGYVVVVRPVPHKHRTGIGITIYEPYHSLEEICGHDIDSTRPAGSGGLYREQKIAQAHG